MSRKADLEMDRILSPTYTAPPGSGVLDVDIALIEEVQNFVVDKGNMVQQDVNVVILLVECSGSAAGFPISSGGWRRIRAGSTPPPSELAHSICF